MCLVHCHCQCQAVSLSYQTKVGCLICRVLNRPLMTESVCLTKLHYAPLLETMDLYWVEVGPALHTLPQLQPNIVFASRVC